MAIGLKCKRPNSVEHKRKPLRQERLLGPEKSTSDTTMEIWGLKPIGCTNQNHVTLVGPVRGYALWCFNVEVAVLVRFTCLNQLVLGVVALELHNGTCSFFFNTTQLLLFMCPFATRVEKSHFIRGEKWKVKRVATNNVL